MSSTNGIIIAAVNKNDVIGNNGTIPWHYPEDLKHYRDTVRDNILIMGRKTFESAPTLENTKHIIMSRRDTIASQSENVYLANSKSEAISLYDDLRENDEKLYICGGEAIYREFLDDVEKMIISHIPDDSQGDTHFPNINDENWEITKFKWIDGFKICVYERIENNNWS